VAVVSGLARIAEHAMGLSRPEAPDDWRDR
jgi:hypothetical protein